MTLRFDDALPALAKLLGGEPGVRIEDVVVLRDVDGRLAVFFESKEAPPDLEMRLREQLGPYIRTDRCLAGAEDYGARAILEDPAVRRVPTQHGRLRVLDRLLVGQDWLQRPRALEAAPPRLVFARIKGGVGRSTALAVTAAEWASRGKNVLVVDLDLEAPGQGSLLLSPDRLPALGAIDYLVETGLREISGADLGEFLGTCALGGPGLVRVLPAVGSASANRPEEMIPKLSRAVAEQLDAQGQVQGPTAKVDSMLDRFVDHESYDLVLIDSRAGFAEMAAGPVMGLGATVLFFGSASAQSYAGYRYLFAHLASLANTSPGSLEWRARLKAVHAKAAPSKDAREQFLDAMHDIMQQLYDEATGEDEDENLFNFDLDDPDAPHAPLVIPFDPRWSLEEPSELLSPDIYRPLFLPFLEGLDRLLEREP